MENILNLTLYFSVYAFLGWVMESVCVSIEEKRIVNRGFLVGPFCPIYGFGAILSVMLNEAVFKIWGSTIITDGAFICLAVFLVTMLEYVTGFLLERIFSCKWWDYSNKAYNFHGYVCLANSLIWGVLIYVLIKIVHPQLIEVIGKSSLEQKMIMCLALAIYFMADTVWTLAVTLKVRDAVMNYSKVSTAKYNAMILKYKRVFKAFPRLLGLNTGVMNREVRRIIYEGYSRIKGQFKNKFQE